MFWTRFFLVTKLLWISKLWSSVWKKFHRCLFDCTTELHAPWLPYMWNLQRPENKNHNSEVKNILARVSFSASYCSFLISSLLIDSKICRVPYNFKNPLPIQEGMFTGSQLWDLWKNSDCILSGFLLQLWALIK